MTQPGVALSSRLSLGELAARFGGWVDEAVRDAPVDRLLPVEFGGEEALCPVISRRYLRVALSSNSLLLASEELERSLPKGRRWVHPHAGYALARVLCDLAIDPSTVGGAIDESAFIGPGAVVLEGARIGRGVRIEPNAVVHGGVIVGARSIIGAGSVIGRAGFGWVHGPGGDVLRVPQLGGVCIEEDVEIGPLCTVDAGTLAPTWIRKGAKLDAQVHVAHNVVVGEGTMVAGQSGFAGSVRIGSRARIGGQVGVADHVTVGDGAVVAAKSGVIGDVPPHAVVAGYPAVPRMSWLRGVAAWLRTGQGVRGKR